MLKRILLPLAAALSLGCIAASAQGIKALENDRYSITSGDVTLKLPEAPGFTCRIDTMPSRFSSDLALEKSGDTYTFGDGSARCFIDTTSGNIRITK